jgi:SpoVK/Ycf46/Vps4 family AAA+-type ATPase
MLQVVNGPEVLNKYVGASEENIRKLFEDAEKDYAANGEVKECLGYTLINADAQPLVY